MLECGSVQGDVVEWKCGFDGDEEMHPVADYQLRMQAVQGRLPSAE